MHVCFRLTCAIMPSFLVLLSVGIMFGYVFQPRVLIVDGLLFLYGVYQHVMHVNCLAFTYIYAHPILKIYHPSWRIWEAFSLSVISFIICVYYFHIESFYCMYSKPPFLGRSPAQGDMWFRSIGQIGQWNKYSILTCLYRGGVWNVGIDAPK